MNNFSKFLTNREDLKSIFNSKKSSVGVYFIILLFLLAFFMIFPMWKIGYQGFALWFFGVILLIILLVKQFIRQDNIYLLTNKRLIHLKAISKIDYKLISFIKISNINKVYKKNNNIIIISNNKKYYLSRVQSADKLYSKLNSYIKY